ncbi:YitT family protein [Planctomicrobium piriforme]|uniref:Membrane proteinase PrsW, cleaves anti-sigma factor RsiW, M82 family n=1 Tax=Planctomicrobium piriforme TaxID=1576369 RepID=A0A1I3L9A6_9PLAN|nr:hypothetical protein [Planctomicrobium piriforme]SFI81076.1 hypothetical protein SAMN05421753_112176 [Planctomicrobium piriforme]
MLFATLVSVLLGACLFGAILVRIARRGDRLALACCLLSALPMCWVMFHFVRMPLDRLLVEWLTPQSGVLTALRLMYAPMTEEPAKLWILLIPWVRKQIRRDNLAAFALALGLGFALGEMVTVAQLVAIKDPRVLQMPWYELSGFILERNLTCLIHSGMTGIALVIWRCGPGMFVGLPTAMLAHFLVNLPIALAGWASLGRNHPFFAIALLYWVVLCYLLSLVFLAWLHTGSVKKLGLFMFGRAKCPTCGAVFDRRLKFAVNFGFNLRYERCPMCGKWNWTRREPSTPDAAMASDSVEKELY